MDHNTVTTVLVVLLSLHHIGDVGVPLTKGIINSVFELLEFAIDRAVTLRGRWQAAKARWKATP